MKNFAFVLMALAAVFVTAESAHAGSGKAKSSKIEFTNTNANGGRAITVFVAKETSSTRPPRTKGEAIRNFTRKTVQAGKTETFRLRDGRYVIGAADAAGFNSLRNSDPVPAGSFDFVSGVMLDSSTDKRDVSTSVNASPYTPTISR